MEKKDSCLLILAIMVISILTVALNLRMNLINANTQISNLKRTIQERDSAIRNLEVEKRSLHSEIQALQNQVNTLFNEREALVTQIDELELQITHLNSKLVAARSDLETRETTIAKLQSEIIKLQTEISRWEQSHYIRDPTYSEVLEFLLYDKTDDNEYIEARYTCVEFAADVNNNAFKSGYRCGFVMIDFPEGAHTIVCFNTTDGMIFVEPQDDRIVKLIVGQPYYDRTYYICDFDDTVVKYAIAW